MLNNISSILFFTILSSLVKKGSSVRIGMMVSKQNEPRFQRHIQRGYEMALKENDTVIEELE